MQHARVWFGGEAPHGLWHVGRCPGCVHPLGVKGGVSAAEGRREGVVEWTDKRAIEPRPDSDPNQPPSRQPKCRTCAAPSPYPTHSPPPLQQRWLRTQRPQADPRAQAARASSQPTPRRASDRSHPRSTRLSSRARSRGSVSSFLCSPSPATLADARLRSIGHVGQDQQLDRTPDGLRRFVRQAVDHEARNPRRSVRRRDREGC